MLVNDRKESPVKQIDAFFQAKIKVSSENNDFIFCRKQSQRGCNCDGFEERSLDLLYRHKKKIYGTGLGTSMDWEINASGVGAIWSDFLPITEVPSMSFSLPRNDLIKDEELSMKYLST